MSKHLPELSFSEVVDLIRQYFAYDDLGYADGARILDRAIQPQIDEQTKLARADELEHLYIYHPRQVSGIIKTDISTTGDEMDKGLYYRDRIKQLKETL